VNEGMTEWNKAVLLKTDLELIPALFPPQDYTSHPCGQGVKKYCVWLFSTSMLFILSSKETG